MGGEILRAGEEFREVNPCGPSRLTSARKIAGAMQIITISAKMPPTIVLNTIAPVKYCLSDGLSRKFNFQNRRGQRS
jgi:hypothetical protein